MSTNTELAVVFSEMSALLELLGANAFRVNAHANVARVLGDLTGDGIVANDDIPPFVATVLAPYAASGAERCAADVNEDLRTDGGDVGAFVSVLLGP